jgi:hypothetical protein
MRDLTFDEYEDAAMSTCMNDSANFMYMMLNLVSEVGEFCGVVGKMVRKGKIVINNNNMEFTGECTPEDEAMFWKLLKGEHGDILWQTFGLGRYTFGAFSNEDNAIGNLDKLGCRQKRGVIDGNGDLR